MFQRCCVRVCVSCRTVRRWMDWTRKSSSLQASTAKLCARGCRRGKRRLRLSISGRRESRSMLLGILGGHLKHEPRKHRPEAVSYPWHWVVTKPYRFAPVPLESENGNKLIPECSMMSYEVPRPGRAPRRDGDAGNEYEICDRWWRQPRCFCLPAELSLSHWLATSDCAS
jgi:hypothetical protein